MEMEQLGSVLPPVLVSAVGAVRPALRTGVVARCSTGPPARFPAPERPRSSRRRASGSPVAQLGQQLLTPAGQGAAPAGVTATSTEYRSGLDPGQVGAAVFHQGQIDVATPGGRQSFPASIQA